MSPAASPARLPARLEAVLRLLPPGPVADVGAGHGLLAAHLALSGRQVVATEVTAGPLEELRRNLAAWGLDGDVPVRAGRGLQALRGVAVDGVVVAGLGADALMVLAAEAPAAGVRWLALQCVQRPWRLRAWIDTAVAERGWRQLASAEPVERGRVYPTWLLAVGEA